VLKKAAASMMTSVGPTTAVAGGGEAIRKRAQTLKKSMCNSRMAPQRRGSHAGTAQAAKSKVPMNRDFPVALCCSINTHNPTNEQQQQQQKSGASRVTMAEPPEFASY
jgi:hypothetical protein